MDTSLPAYLFLARTFAGEYVTGILLVDVDRVQQAKT
jgi:hypothetical protein